MLKTFKLFENDIDPLSEENWDEDNTVFDFNLEQMIQEIEGTFPEKLQIIRNWLENNFVVDHVGIYNENELYFQFNYNVKNLIGRNKIKSDYATFKWKKMEDPLTIRLVCHFGYGETNGYCMGNDKYHWERILVRNNVPKK
jgi:hypothetical protein